VDKDVWEEAVREDANEKVMGSYNKCEGRVHTEEGEGVSVVKGGKRRSERICERIVAEGIYSAVKITADGTSILCREEGWKKEDSSGLSIS